MRTSQGCSDFDLKEAMLQDKYPTLICEIKYASPSAGRIRDDKDAAVIAQEMIKGGASALSVLTQPHMFSGSPEILMRVRKSVNVPILMKDIIIDTVQIDAGKKMGAGATFDHLLCNYSSIFVISNTTS